VEICNRIQRIVNVLFKFIKLKESCILITQLAYSTGFVQISPLGRNTILCGLAHVQPIGAKSRWPRKARELTRLLLEKREGWIRILGSIRDEAAIIALELRRESMDEMSSLTDLLVGMGCAQYTNKEIAAALPGILD